MTEQLRLMAVHAHPDDESSKGAATMAKYVSEGVDVLVATCTGGERGSVLNPKLQGDPYIEEHIHEVRAKEMDEAREILGVKQSWLGFVDSGLPEGDPLPPLPDGCFAVQDVEEAAGALVKLIREFKPQVITTYDENGGYPHPDHIMTHKISMIAFEAAGDPERYPEAGEPWTPQKLYYNQGFNKARTVAMHEALLSRGLESPYAEWLERWKQFDRPERQISTHVPCADFFEIRDKALLAHATQIDPDGAWFHVPMEIQQEVWPTEDYELAKSLVDTSLPEDDLFAGIRTA
ncbi:mycothiol conjugate amidase Mca [Streptomyces sp. SID13666]|uniref:mycothiol conjugate amidase Mca n=1 Tax=Streptomyces TaxID=1883 RepID=UPI001106CD62|nr:MULTISPECIES: mycothiol conjugate amidase Mca [Streptomyces]MCM2421292.1 mycothiol conjugate amidase Mca [Streptomyces sp. RKAG293]MCM2426505.1 mycothiol conjugate amidase Mca [Streptomyces sp. RKAG337]MCZ4100407.1 mycothiol conjugate amidase Mca [Streptomyces sp. H39-C1]NEA58394.1 mycothiol conjugate amidase Mca [Streptomyces sp. SID13666]NEA73636.1 mycothiol conjugate amidase Mca [Streptomyces sp. SID13588]